MLTSSSNPSRAGDTSAGVFFPRHSGDRASDTPVANPSYILSASSSFPDVACFFVLAARPLFDGLERIGGCGDSPRSSSAPARESRHLVRIRDAFHRQRPFVGSGGHYSPGPATDTPPFGRWADRSMTLSRHRGSSSGPFPSPRNRPEPRRPFARRTRRWFHPPPFTSS